MSAIHVTYEWSGRPGPFLARRGSLAAAADGLDPERLLADWERWGEALPRRLPDDFAYVLWDGQALHAARDAMGVRPLYYRWTQTGIAFASDLAALLEPRPPVSDLVLRDHLLGVAPPRDLTVWEGVRRLRPGERLVAVPGRVSSLRWFHPPRVRQDVGENDFRRAFFEAVRVRLLGGPILAQLSGGLDSSSIACVIEALGGSARLVSAVFPGLDCDESPFIDAVTKRLRHAHERWDATVVPAPGRARAASPDRWHEAPLTSGWHAIAVREGARAVLSGMGGDQLLFEEGVFCDLAAHGRLFALLNEARLAPRYSSRPASAFLRGAVVPLIPSWLRRTRRRAPVDAPWMGRRLKRRPSAPPEADPPFDSHTQRLTWRWLNAPSLVATLEAEHAAAAPLGVELRYPFLDRRLIELVLAMPWEARVPGGRMKRLLRSSLADLLPPEIAARSHVTTFDSAYLHFLKARAPGFRALLSQPVLASEPWIDRGHVHRLLDEFARAPTLATGRFLFDLASLEEWLAATGAEPTDG